MSWSLPAVEACPGCKNEDGTLVPACSGCYATTGYYRMKAAKNARANNMLVWKEPEWVDVMVFTIKDQEHFRWFDSGDVYDLELARKIYEIMQRTPNTKHWLPSRTWKIPELKAVLDNMNALPNVVVRYSSDSITGEYQKGLHGSVIIPSADFETEAYICPATKTHGKCENCKACWDKNVKTVAYVAHGKTMLKIIRELTTAPVHLYCRC